MSDSDWNFAQNFPDDIGRLGEYLARLGQPIHCRLDIRMTSLEELKKAAVLVSELNKSLNRLAYEDERDPVLRVMLARDAMLRAQHLLKYLKPKKAAQRVRVKNTTRSVSWPVQVGSLDRPFKRSDVSE
jgi:hypothetical protein